MFDDSGVDDTGQNSMDVAMHVGYEEQDSVGTDGRVVW